MGDIDDFFAKKDKKKKGAKKFSKANTDVLAKNLEENERREQKELERQGKDLGIPLPEDKASVVLNTQDDEEWDDYRENRKDYSGLKIETLKIEDPPEDEEEETEINEDGELVTKKKDESGPWNKVMNHNNDNNQQESKPEPEPEPAANVTGGGGGVGGSYVPPHMRNAASSTWAQVKKAPARGSKSRVAPDINDVNFPSLSSAVEDAKSGSGGWNGGRPGGMGGPGGRRPEDEGQFREVREGGGGKQSSSRQGDAPRLALGNKFDALRDGE